MAEGILCVRFRWKSASFWSFLHSLCCFSYPCDPLMLSFLRFLLTDWYHRHHRRRRYFFTPGSGHKKNNTKITTIHTNMHSLSVCSHVFLCKMIMDVVLWTRVQVRSSFSFLFHRWLETLLCMDNLIIIPTASHPNAFSALTMMVGQQEGQSACKNWAVGYWHSYLSAARCRLAYGPAHATATHCHLLQ